MNEVRNGDRPESIDATQAIPKISITTAGTPQDGGTPLGGITPHFITTQAGGTPQAADALQTSGTPQAADAPQTTDDPNTTQVIPRISDDPNATQLIGKVLDPPPPEPPKPRWQRRAEQARLEAERRAGVQVIPLRAKQTDKGYHSIHSELTRTTFGTAVRTTARTLGEILITCGLVVLLFAAWEVYGKAALVNAHQKELDKQLAQDWGAPAPPPQPGASPSAEAPLPPVSGRAVARLFIARLHKNWIIVQGVQQADIALAPGHYPESAMPGQPGNFAVAGHRNPATFWDLDQVKPGDFMVVETRTDYYVYKVTRNFIVSPFEVSVVAPVPGKKLLTLTTCHPKWDNYQRLIVQGELVRQQPRDKGVPAEAKG